MAVTPDDHGPTTPLLWSPPRAFADHTIGQGFLAPLDDADDEVTEYLTTSPAAEYDPIDVVNIYTLRTMIEIFFRETKQYTSIENVNSTTLDGVLFELFATSIGYLLVELYEQRHPH